MPPESEAHLWSARFRIVAGPCFVVNTGTYGVSVSPESVDVVLSLNLDRHIRSLKNVGVDVNAGVSALVTHEPGHDFGISASLYSPAIDGEDMLISRALCGGIQPVFTWFPSAASAASVRPGMDMEGKGMAVFHRAARKLFPVGTGRGKCF